MKRGKTMEDYFSAKRYNIEKHEDAIAVDGNISNENISNLINIEQQEMTNISGNIFDSTTSTDNYSDSDSDTGDINEFNNKPNIENNYFPATKIYSGPADISQNINDGPKQPVITFYPKTKYGNRWRHFSKQWFITFPWLEYSILEDAAQWRRVRLK